MKEKEIYFLSLEKENKLMLVNVKGIPELTEKKYTYKGAVFGDFRKFIDWLKDKRKIGKRVIIVW